MLKTHCKWVFIFKIRIFYFCIHKIFKNRLYLLTLFKMLWYNLFVVKYFMWRNTQVWLKGPVLKTGRSETARGFESLFLRHSYLSNIAEWSSLVARRAHNPKVVGSNPASATIWFRSVVVITSACHAEDREFEPRRNRHLFWLRSSVGRARDWKSLCRWFDSGRSHHFLILYYT